MAALLVGLAVAARCPGQCEYEVTVIEGPRSAALGQASMYSANLNEQGHVVGFFRYTEIRDSHLFPACSRALMTAEIGDCPELCRNR